MNNMELSYDFETTVDDLKKQYEIDSKKIEYINVRYHVSFDDMQKQGGIEFLRDDLTPFDNDVLDAIATLHINGVEVFTPKDIWYLIGIMHMGAEDLAKIILSLEKLSFLHSVKIEKEFKERVLSYESCIVHISCTETYDTKTNYLTGVYYHILNDDHFETKGCRMYSILDRYLSTSEDHFDVEIKELPRNSIIKI